MISRYLRFFLQGAFKMDLPDRAKVTVVGFTPTPDFPQATDFTIKSFSDLFKAIDSLLPNSKESPDVWFIIYTDEKTIEVKTELKTFKGLVYHEHRQEELLKFMTTTDKKLKRLSDKSGQHVLDWYYTSDLKLVVEYTNGRVKSYDLEHFKKL